MLNSQQQYAYDQVIESVNSGNNESIEIMALPGTGKSHLAAEICNDAVKMGKYVAYIAFTNQDVSRMQKKLDSRVICTTNHKLGMKQFPHNIGKIDDQHIDLFLLSQKVDRRFMSDIKLLISLGKGYNVKSYEELEQVFILHIGSFSKPFIAHSSENIGYAFNGVQLSAGSKSNVDDLLYKPVLNEWQKDSFDLMIVDESQDSNEIQRILNTGLTRVLVMIGDNNQAIYFFRGSHYKELENSKKLTLSLTYRFGQKIADYVNPIFKTDIQAIDNKESNVYEVATFEPENLKDNNDMVIARTNAELIPIAIKLLLSGKNINMSNRYALVEYINFILSHSHDTKCKNCDDLLTAKFNSKSRYGIPFFFTCGNWGKSADSCKGDIKGFNEVLKHDNQKTIENITNTINTLLQSASEDEKSELNEKMEVCKLLLREHSIDQLTKVATKIVSHPDGIRLTTSHGSKGDESKNVYVLTQGFNKVLTYCVEHDANDIVISQEFNMFFVALTRVIENLYVVGEDWIGK